MSTARSAAPAHDLLVVGSGVAGLTAALEAAPRCRVALVTKAGLDEGCSRWAQGGIAAAVGSDDSAEAHLADTVAAGRGLCDEDAVRVLVEEAPARIRRLLEWGVAFDTVDGELQLGREAAHTRNRILHARGDGTGLEMETALIRRLRASGVRVLEHRRVVRLVVDGSGRCAGVDLEEVDTGRVQRIAATTTLLASGGAAALWEHTTNPPTATGDGVALAYAAGADVAGMEFVQFHPTALALAGAPRFLISEAVRGEGALVLDGQGRRFLADADPRAELAPRDVVAQAIWAELQRSGEPCVWLDCRPLGARAALRFPSIHRTCLEHGVDLTRDLVPIAPAAHYLIGGVRTDLWGATSVPGLYAAGEVASTGVHGANRLASNSLLESVVFAHRAVVAALGSNAEARPPVLDDAPGGRRPPADDPAALATVRRAMWQGAGLVRDEAGLAAAATTLGELGGFGADDAEALPPLDAVHLTAITASLVCAAARARRESRGAHVRADFPQTDPGQDGVLILHRDRGIRLDRNPRHHS